MASAIILAAGSGHRMKSPVAKQYLDLGGIPVLARTLMAFDNHPAVENIFLVVAQKELEFCRKTILSSLLWEKNIMIVAGGKQRQDSVYEGLKAAERFMTDREIIVIHDGARPLVSGETITACIDGAEKSGACIPCLPASDTLKQVDSGGFVTATVSRTNIWIAQTPQAFSFKLLKQGFENAIEKGLAVTDDAAVIEDCGGSVQVISGSRKNIKITTPEDLDMARALLQVAGES